MPHGPDGDSGEGDQGGPGARPSAAAAGGDAPGGLSRLAELLGVEEIAPGDGGDPSGPAAHAALADPPLGPQDSGPTFYPWPSSAWAASTSPHPAAVDPAEGMAPDGTGAAVPVAAGSMDRVLQALDGLPHALGPWQGAPGGREEAIPTALGLAATVTGLAAFDVELAGAATGVDPTGPAEAGAAGPPVAPLEASTSRGTDPGSPSEPSGGAAAFLKAGGAIAAEQFAAPIGVVPHGTSVAGEVLAEGAAGPAGQPPRLEPGGLASVPLDDAEPSAVEELAEATPEAAVGAPPATAFGPLAPVEASEPLPDDVPPAEPTDPEPTDPEPRDPEPRDPEPRDPEPRDPEPTDPEPRDPEPTDPEPRDPEPRDPEPTDPEPTDPEPRDPEPRVQPVQPPADRDSVGSRFAEALPAEEPASGSPSATAPGKLPNQEVHASGLGNSHAPQGEPGALDRGPEDGRAIGGEGPDGPVASTDRHAADAEEADPEEGAAGGSPGAARNALDDLLDDPVDYRQALAAEEEEAPGAGGSPGAARNALDDLLDDPVDYRQALAAEEAGQDPRDGVSDPAGADQAGADPILAYLEGTSVTVDFAELRAALSDHDGGAASHPRGASWPGPWGGDSDDGFADDDSANGAAGADGVWAHGPPDPGPGHHDGPAGTPGFGSLPDDALGSDADHAGFPDR